MKLIFFLFLAGVTSFSCTRSNKKSLYDRGMDEAYEYSFRTTYFNKLLREGFNHSEAIKSVLAFDNSHYGEVILSLSDFQLIDSLAKEGNKEMVRDSINRIGRVSEGAQGKRIFDYALLKYQSKWLDSIIRVRRDLWNKQSEAE